MRQLFDLQELDLEVDRCQAEMDSIAARLKDDSALVRARAELAEREENIRQVQRQHARQNLEAQASKEKLRVLEQRLYGGSVRNPRELESLQEELSYAKKQAADAEEELLKLMIGLEESEAALAKARTKLAEMEGDWALTQAAMSKEQAAAMERLLGFKGRRQQLVGGILASVLTQYEQLRRTRQGRAVAKVERGMCTGCRITLPTKELQLLRTAREPVQCSSCGRLLYVS